MLSFWVLLISGMVMQRPCRGHSLDGGDDLSEITWAHAVNSRAELEDALSGDVDFLEADISVGNVVGKESGPKIPIMAHPPDDTSDISFEQWLDFVISRASGKGIKLDFKSILAVEPTLDALRKHERKINFPLWLNADILPGPVNANQMPVSAEEFIRFCKDRFPNATLSVGWTTYWFETFDPTTWHYGWNHVRAMADVLDCVAQDKKPKVESPLTFPVRAVFTSRSIPQLRWLLDRFPKSTLTVWSGKKDSVDVDDLLTIRRAFEPSRVYYDVPEPLRRDFVSRKNREHTGMRNDMKDSFRWTRVHTGPSVDGVCSSKTYIDNETIMFGKDSVTALLSTRSYNVRDGTNLKIQGTVSFFLPTNNETRPVRQTKHQLLLVLANAASVPRDSTGNETLTSMNESVLHTFEQDFSSKIWSCHFFMLDTTTERKFQAWTLPCDLESLSEKEMMERGTTEVPNSKRLVLPTGPIRFGFISSGEGHVVVHDLLVQGEEVVSGSEGLFSSAIVIGVLIVTVAILIL